MKRYGLMLLLCCMVLVAVAFLHTAAPLRPRSLRLFSTTVEETSTPTKFNLTTALFCAGLAFDAYTEPPQDSARWERSSQGMNAAFCSNAFTRSLYKGLVEVKPIAITDLPDEDDTAEGLISGGGTDAYLLVSVIEGQWKEDIQTLQSQQYHEGVLGLMGAAHVGRSRTAWSNVNVHKSKALKRKTGQAVPYHVPSTWGKGGQANFTEHEPPFYLYVQDPAEARLVFTVMDDDVIGDGDAVGSAYQKLTNFIPFAKYSGQQVIDRLKGEVLEKIKRGELLSLEDENALLLKTDGWQGSFKLTSKPRKKDKNSQMAMGAAAGAVVAGPVGAAVGGFLGSMYEGEIRGRVELRLRYLPFPPEGIMEVKRLKHEVKGGLEGVNWGEMYDRYRQRTEETVNSVPDLEHCFFINHDETGATCAVYRSLEKRMIVVSFRGTCQPVDLITDATITQDAWTEGEDVSDMYIPKVHAGFRKSLQSISRRLKELILATPASGEDISLYDMYVTGHSLGGALATLFVTDIAQSGIDAGRALPQLDPSDSWWKSIASTFLGSTDSLGGGPPPPRPKTLRLYNFGSPRVGNEPFSALFDELKEAGHIKEAYRVVNGEDLVARHPRTMNALALGNVGYDHCGSTVLVTLEGDTVGEDENGEPIASPKIWIEGESDNSLCPVRDGTPLTSPLEDGSLLAELVNTTKGKLEEHDEKSPQVLAFAKTFGKVAGALSEQFQKSTFSDLPTALGIKREFTEREMKMIQSILKGEALSHHMEDEYYAALGRAAGFKAQVGEDLVEVDEGVSVNV